MQSPITATLNRMEDCAELTSPAMRMTMKQVDVYDLSTEDVAGTEIVSVPRNRARGYVDEPTSATIDFLVHEFSRSL
ncbi:unnamed protein product [Dicrocoelium dendriticum]|nr:unnamed protein product [Dicrocoelium dendriticum]